jgi:UDP:flavonoid glycosyltransferase YjiC (YdhE family)
MNVLFAISAHGLGHGALTLPLVEALRRQVPGCRIVLHTRLPRDWLASRLSGPFAWTGKGRDFGLHMHSPVDVDVDASAAAYAEIHRHWEQWVDDEREVLRAHAPDVVVSNVSFLAMEAARLEGIPAVTFCPFTWLDTHRVYCNRMPDAAAIQEKLRRAYAWATTHIRPEPSVPLTDDWPSLEVGPVCARGKKRGGELKRRLGVADEALVLVTFGGIEGWADWSFVAPSPGIHWLVTDDCPLDRADVTRTGQVPVPFTDLLASVDLVVTKLGYATFTEAVAAGVPMIALERPDWPEWPVLQAYAERHLPFAPLGRDELTGQRVGELVDRLLGEVKPDGYGRDGSEAAAAIVARIARGQAPA